MARYGGEPGVVVGVTVAGRPPELPGVEAMVGNFINVLPLRLRYDPGAGAVPGGDERHGLGPVGRGGLLRRGDLRQPVRGAEQRTAAGEDGHEPPVTGAGRG